MADYAIRGVQSRVSASTCPPHAADLALSTDLRSIALENGLRESYGLGVSKYGRLIVLFLR